MKKVILTFALTVGILSAANAQVDSRNIGLRFGGYGVEASYQHPFGSANRLEAALGLSDFDDNLFSLTATYQWVWDLSELASGFNWYAGFGGGLAAGNNYFGVGPFGQIGIEYNFEIPLQLSLDYRPGILFGDGGGNWTWDGIALGVRYKF